MSTPGARNASSVADFLIVGGGIIGLAVARALRRREPGARITVIEKEDAPGRHASGRNSGVLHAGFYYSPDSLKARFTRSGNAAMTDFCLEQGVPIRRCGKLVVARSESELVRLEELYERGLANGVKLELISPAEAHELEPRAIVHEKAIWSPTTSSVDPGAVMAALHAAAVREGIDVVCGTAYLGPAAGGVRTSAGTFGAGYVVNAAGLHADRVAHDFGAGLHYRILPFRGAYLLSDEPPHAFRRHVYPVPDPAFPFLGVHLTVTVDGHAKLGPTAAPALSREHYGGVASIHPGETPAIALRLAGLVLHDAALRRHTREEMRKLSPRNLVALASTLVSGLRAEDYRRRGASGIRAQLYDTARRRLEMDFVIEQDERALHILNAVSPAFTGAFPFAEEVAVRILTPRRAPETHPR